MSSKTIGLIIILMSLSSLGIIFFQFYWIGELIEQKQAELNRDIDKALSNFEESLIENEAMSFLNEGIKIRSSNHILKDGKAEFRYTTKIKVENEVSDLDEIDEKIEVISGEGFEGKVIVHEGKKNEFEIIKLEDSSRSRLQLIERFNQKKSQLNEAINDIAFEFAFKERSFAERFDGMNADSLLLSSLENEGLKGLNYHYEITDSNKDSVIVGTMLDKDVEDIISKPLLGSKGSKDNGLLRFQLMGQQSYLILSLWPIIGTTTLLILVMLFTFGFTLHRIFRQKKLSQMKSDFINNMTHEFKTPIATISLALDAIFHPESKSSPKEVEKFGDIIRKENERMHRQVESLLQAAQFEKGEINLKIEKLSVHELLTELSDLLVQSRKSEVSPKINFSLVAKNDHILADKMHLFNVFRNLFENAIKFSSDRANIHISSRNENGDLIVEVADEGIGMSRKTMEHIFDSFYRHTEGDLHQTKGFGLGLSYVKDVVEKLDGEIWVESKLKEGSRFFIRLKSESNA